MFNSPRPVQPYNSSSSNGFGSGSYVVDNPLTASVYDDGLDPWSTTPSPAPPPIPALTSPSGLNSVIGEIYSYHIIRTERPDS